MNSPRLVVATLVVAMLAAWLAHGMSVDAQEPEATRVVEGRVVNGTPGAAIEPGLTVLLHTSTATLEEDAQTVAGPDGRFRFEGITYDPGGSYAVSVEYGRAVYGTVLDLSDGPPSPVELTVYEVVGDQSVLSVTSASVLLLQSDPGESTILALEIIEIENSADRTYEPGASAMDLMRFGLPPGARELSVETSLSGDVLQVDLGFALTASVPPGKHQIMYSYQFPYVGTEATLDKSYPYGAESLRLLTPYEVGGLASAQLGPSEAVIIGESPYHLITATDLPRGAEVSFSLVDLTQPSLMERLSRRAADVPYEYAAAVGLGLLMTCLVVFAVWKRGGVSARGVEGADSVLPDAERARLTRELAGLEDELESGATGEEEHARRREELRARLAAIARGASGR